MQTKLCPELAQEARQLAAKTMCREQPFLGEKGAAPNGDTMTEVQAIQWGEEEARATLASFRNDLKDGYTADEALAHLIAMRSRAACFIDVPRAWVAYRDTLLAGLPVYTREALMQSDAEVLRAAR